jgi:CRISPR-associated protein Cas5t
LNAVLVEAYQATACYALPAFRTNRIITYPLPPYSTVIGMVHAACGWKTYHDLKISVAGKSTAKDTVFETAWKGGLLGTESEEFKNRFPVRLQAGDDKVVGWVKSVVQRDIVTDVSLRLHISGKDESENEEILHGILYPKTFLSLGRYEDLLRIDNAKIVQIEKDYTENIWLDMDCYVPFNFYMSGTVYNIHKKYTISCGKRVFENVPTCVFGGNTYLTDMHIIDLDELGNPVFFA